MSATVAAAIGNLDPFEQPPQGEGSDDADPCEERAHLQVLRQRLVQAEDREDQDLRDDCDAIADDHVGDGFDQRHVARLFQDGTPSSIGQQFSCQSSERMRCNQGDHAVATEAKPVHPVGQPISASTNSGFKVRRASEISVPAIGVTRTWRPSRPFTGVFASVVAPSL
jgi:hypothetical protein